MLQIISCEGDSPCVNLLCDCERVQQMNDVSKKSAGSFR